MTSTVPPGTGHAFGTGLARTPRGRIVQSVRGADSESGSLVQYTSRGRLDRSFGDRGSAALRFDSGVIDPRDVLVGSRGKIFAAGEGKSKESGSYGGGLASLRPDGRTNRGFADDGLALPEELEGFTPTEMAFAPGGKIVVVGHFGGLPTTNTLVARYMPDGRLDDSFSGDGVVKFDVTLNQLSRTVAVDRRGRIVVGSPGGFEYAHAHDIVRLLPNGRFDRSFGSRGRSAIDPIKGFYEEITDLAIDRHGRILVAGGSNSYAGTVVRLRPGGDIDRRFGRRGVTQMPWFTPSSLAIDRRGRVLAIGFFSSGNSDESGQVVRLGRRGREDYSFAGRVSGATLLRDGFVDPRGRVVVGGNRSPDELVVARLLGR